MYENNFNNTQTEQNKLSVPFGVSNLPLTEISHDRHLTNIFIRHLNRAYNGIFIKVYVSSLLCTYRPTW